MGRVESEVARERDEGWGLINRTLHFAFAGEE